MPQTSSDPQTLSDDEIVIGSPDAPAFKRRPMVFVISLALFGAWLAILVYWALRIRWTHH